MQKRHYLVAAAVVSVMTAVLSLTSTRPVVAQGGGQGGGQPLEDSRKQIFRRNSNLTFGTFGGNCDSPTTIPAGKRLVLEYFSVTAETVGTDELIFAQIRSLAFNDIYASGVPTFGGVPSGSTFRFYGLSLPLKLYFDPSAQNIMVCAFKTGTTDVAFFQSVVSGYLVDAP